MGFLLGPYVSLGWLEWLKAGSKSIDIRVRLSKRCGHHAVLVSYQDVKDGSDGSTLSENVGGQGKKWQVTLCYYSVTLRNA
jgi:hypothetical protein